MMKRNRIMHLLSAAAVCAPVIAIEPPVEAEPIPPQAPPVAVDGAAPAAEAPAGRDRGADQAVPMPQVGRPYLGVILDPLPELLAGHLKLPAGKGLLIADLAPGGPAANAGIRANDVLLAIDGQQVGSVEEVRGITHGRKVGDKVRTTVIQDGEQREFEIELAAAPELPAGGAGQAGGNEAMLEEMLGNLPEKHADALRQALEDNMRALEDLDDEAGRVGPGNDLMRRLREQMGRRGMPFDLNIQGGFQSTVRLMDGEGSVELRSSDKGKEAKVFDKEGNVLWEGPYETEQDKAAVPDDIRGRLEKLNFGDGEAGGFQLKILPDQFRRLDEVAPEEPAEPVDPPEEE